MHWYVTGRVRGVLRGIAGAEGRISVAVIQNALWVCRRRSRSFDAWCHPCAPFFLMSGVLRRALTLVSAGRTSLKWGKLMLNLQHRNYSRGHLKRLVLTGGLITLALVVLSFPFPLPLMSTILLLTSRYYIYTRDACTEPVGCVIYPHCGLPNSVLMACFQLHLG